MSQDNAPEGQSFGTPEEPTAVVMAEHAPEPQDAGEELDLDRALILSAPDAKLKRVRVPEWDRDGKRAFVWIKDMGGEGRDEFEVATTMQGEQNLRNVRAKLLAVCLCNSKGERLFTAADVEALGKKNAAPISRLYNEASKLNFISDKDVEELAKNSGGEVTSTT